MLSAAFLFVAIAACDEAALDLSASTAPVVKVSKARPTTLAFARPIREVTLRDARFLSQAPTRQAKEVTFVSSGEFAETTATFDFEEGVRLGPITLVRDETAPCLVKVYWPLWAQLDSLKAELGHAKEEARLLRTTPAVATIGHALLTQPKDRPSMFRVETRKVSAHTETNEVTADALLAYWLFDLSYVVLRIGSRDPSWGFSKVSATGGSIVGTFLDPEIDPIDGRQVVIAVKQDPKARGPVILTVHDLTDRRPLQLPPLDLQ
jgi:hypothetical protein